MRSIGTRPAPRSMRAVKNCEPSRAPVAAATRPARSSAAPRVALLARMTSVGSPERRTRATCSIRSCAGALRAGAARAGTTGALACCHDVSPGRISVAICPGCALALATALAASHAIVSAESARRTQWLSGRARPSMSDVNGGSYFRCDAECSPMMLTMPDDARLALWMFASPFARPGPRCSKVDAGVSFMRYQPSAAPVATPSNRHSTLRIRSLPPSAARKCISDVPGLAKQMSTPWSTSVLTRLSAPFIADPSVAGHLAGQAHDAIGALRGGQQDAVALLGEAAMVLGGD